MGKLVEQATVLAREGRKVDHPLLNKRAKLVIQTSSMLVLELAERVEQLEAQQCQQQKTTESQ